MRPIIPIFLVLCLALPLCADDAQTRARKELEQVIATISTGLPSWTKFDASGYTLFYSGASAPHSGAAGLYLSTAPFKRAAQDSSEEIPGRIGGLDVKWTKQVIDDGSIQQDAIVALRPHLFAHVLIESRSEADLELFVSEIGRLPIFSSKEVAAAAAYSGPGFFDPHLRARERTQASARKE